MDIRANFWFGISPTTVKKRFNIYINKIKKNGDPMIVILYLAAILLNAEGLQIRAYIAKIVTISGKTTIWGNKD